jgi:Holliday junction resolvase
MALGKKPTPRWKKQEKEIAGKVKGKVSKASGASYQKADVRKFGIVRLECKSTSKKSFRVDEKMIDKLEKDAFGAGEIPVIAVEILNGKRKVYVIPDYCLDFLLCS